MGLTDTKTVSQGFELGSSDSKTKTPLNITSLKHICKIVCCLLLLDSMDQDTIVEKEEKNESEEDEEEEKTIIEETPPEEQKIKSADNAAEGVLEIMMIFLEGEVSSFNCSQISFSWTPYKTRNTDILDTFSKTIK